MNTITIGKGRRRWEGEKEEVRKGGECGKLRGKKRGEKVEREGGREVEKEGG